MADAGCRGVGGGTEWTGEGFAVGERTARGGGVAAEDLSSE